MNACVFRSQDEGEQEDMEADDQVQSMAVVLHEVGGSWAFVG